MQVELTDEEIEFLRYVMIAAPKVYVIRSYCFPRNLAGINDFVKIISRC